MNCKTVTIIFYFLTIQLTVYNRTITRFIADDKIIVYQRVRREMRLDSDNSKHDVVWSMRAVVWNFRHEQLATLLILVHWSHPRQWLRWRCTTKLLLTYAPIALYLVIRASECNSRRNQFFAYYSIVYGYDLWLRRRYRLLWLHLQRGVHSWLLTCNGWMTVVYVHFIVWWLTDHWGYCRTSRGSNSRSVRTLRQTKSLSEFLLVILFIRGRTTRSLLS